MKYIYICSLAIILLTGCASYEKKVPYDEKASEEHAYIYGRFFIDTPSAKLALYGHHNAGLVFKCGDGSNHTFQFFNDKPVFAAKIKPEHCSYSETIYSDVDGNVKGRKPYLGTQLQHIDFKPGKAYYIGDYTANFSSQLQGNMIHQAWKISEQHNFYLKTTKDMHEQYPGLANLETIDLADPLPPLQDKDGIPEVNYLKDLMNKKPQKFDGEKPPIN